MAAQYIMRTSRPRMVIFFSAIAQVIHNYPDIHIRLTLFNCSIAEGTPKLLEHHDLKWILPSEIPNYDFCPADTDILAMIQTQFC